MINLTINGIPVQVEKGTSVLEAARFLGLPIPTLCHEDGLTSYGACRLCVVEIGKEPRTKLVSSCTYRCEEGLVVRTNSVKVQRARKLLLELYVATSPMSKRIQDLASELGVRQCRYEAKLDTLAGPVGGDDCIQCGLCVRICKEQMAAGAIGFAGRGKRRHVARPFNMTDEVCRQCGACLYICPVCEQRCSGSTATTTLCNGCVNFAPVCFNTYDDAMCFRQPCVACELSGPVRSDVHVKLTAQPAATKSK